MPIRFLDMFAGIGGFRSGLERLGGFECVGYCGIDKYAKQAYDAMYPTKGELYFADARTIDPYTLPDIDLICGGFPCQSFSIAGLRRGFQDDTRGTLFFEIARIAAVKRPPFLLLENVPGLLSHDKGRTFATILGTLDELGYCRVSTKQDEQLNSYEVQRTHYEERIRTEPKWSLVGIFADKGITGTSMKKRDEFNKMLRLCYKGKIDMIIVKSISRFARNTLDVIKITRKLREINVDVYFEEQGIHSIDPASEFYITIYGSIAQSESENISANVKWGKAQSAKQGNVPFQCKHFLGYTKNADGEIEIVPEEAEIIREIYEQYLSGESLYGIKCYLEEKEIPTPAGCSVWRQETIRSILSNEKYKGDAIINKTYVSDFISKRVKANNGERNKYYIENNHPAIIDAGTFARVQEEIARRSGKPKVKQKGTKTELSRYSSRYALSELLICGECRTPYRRCTWTAKGKRKIVWRCINRLDYGKKYCHHSPSIEESLLQDAVMRAIMQTAKQNVEVLKTLKIHIGMGLTDEVTEDKTLDIQIRIAEIDAEFQKMLKAVSADNADGIDEERITELMNEKQRLTVQIEQYAAMRQKRESAKSRLDEIFTILDGLQNHPMEYDDKLVRQIIECIVVESKEKIKVVFIGGTEIEMTL